MTFFGVGRIMKDRTNPFDRYSEADFILKFRFSKEGVQVVFDVQEKGRVKNSLQGGPDLYYSTDWFISCTASCRSPLDSILSFLSLELFFSLWLNSVSPLRFLKVNETINVQY